MVVLRPSHTSSKARNSSRSLQTFSFKKRVGTASWHISSYLLGAVRDHVFQRILERVEHSGVCRVFVVSAVPHHKRSQFLPSFNIEVFKMEGGKADLSLHREELAPWNTENEADDEDVSWYGWYVTTIRKGVDALCARTARAGLPRERQVYLACPTVILAASRWLWCTPTAWHGITCSIETVPDQSYSSVAPMLTQFCTLSSLG